MNEEKSISQGIPRDSHERTLHKYQVPERMWELGVKEIGLVELTANEELMASKRTRTDLTRLGFELAKESLRFVDGKKLLTADGSADRGWDVIHPKIRNLVIQAYGDIHQPKSEDVAGFLQSHKVVVG